MSIVWHMNRLHNGRFTLRKRTTINAFTRREHCETVAVAFHNAHRTLVLSYPVDFEQMPSSARHKTHLVSAFAATKAFVQRRFFLNKWGAAHKRDACST